MSSVALIPVVLGVIGLLAAFVVYRSVLAYSPGTGKVTEIGEKIHKGALVFMRREYSYLAIFVIVVGAAIFISDLGWKTTVAFFVGALASASAGYIGMFTATRANVRTTTAAAESGAPAALTVAFFGLGDKSFEIFNGGCKKMRTAMVDRCGAKELLEPTYGDTGGDNPSGKGDSIVSLDECHDRWIESVLPKLDAHLGIKA